MIITQTPLRISFAGGGTDFREFYEREEGCVVSSAINKYIFVIVKQRFDRKIRVGYTRSELVDRVGELQHELVREALNVAGIDNQIEVSTMADIPSEGSGLGSSSAVTVGVLNALHVYLGHARDPMMLARQACDIEINILGKPIGVQDQYIAALGNLRFMRFKSDGTLETETIVLTDRSRRVLNDNLMLFWTNTTRKAETILSEQRSNIHARMPELRDLKALAIEARVVLEQGNLDQFGDILHRGWMIKKRLASKVSNGQLDDIYQAARKAGAIGGKITGAGGGGFLLLYCPREKHDCVREALRGFQAMPFGLECDGTKVIFNYRH
jgi:D-glycero-alpha-D-manno-heptose-7-phosphate kinase